MSVHVTTHLKTRPEHTNDVIAALSEALPHSLQHEGCEAIQLRQDQDQPTNIISFTQSGTRQNYENYLAWRTETGMTDEIDSLLTEGDRPRICVGISSRKEIDVEHNHNQVG